MTFIQQGLYRTRFAVSAVAYTCSALYTGVGYVGPVSCAAWCAGRAERGASGESGGSVSGVRARRLRGLNCRASVPLGRRAHARYRRLPSALPRCKIVYKNLTDYCKNTDILQYVSSHVSVLEKLFSKDVFILPSRLSGRIIKCGLSECNHNVASGRRGCLTK